MTPTETYSCTGTAAALGALLLVCGPATAQGAPAGREITNVATVTYVVSGRPGSADSNTASDRVHELLGVAAAARLQTPVVASDGETARPLAFVLTNAGNGPEAYRLTLEIPATTGAFVPACPRLAIDSNGDGAFDASDAFYGDDAEPVLAPGASVTVFALCDVPQAVNDGQRATVTLKAAALTGSGQPGLTFAGRGVDGVDAVVGPTTAAGSAAAELVVELGRPELLKTASVSDPSGGPRVIAGALVTYVLTARIAGRGRAQDVVIEDAVPTGASYVAGSLRLDGQSLSDSADADPGRFNGDAVEVALGALEPSMERRVSFQVRVN